MAPRKKPKKTRDADLLFAALLEAQAAIISYKGAPPPDALTEGYRAAVLRFNKVPRYERASALRDGAMAIREMVRDNGGENTTGRPARKYVPPPKPKAPRKTRRAS